MGGALVHLRACGVQPGGAPQGNARRESLFVQATMGRLDTPQGYHKKGEAKPAENPILQLLL